MKAPRILLSLLFSSLLLQAHALIPTDRKQRLTEHWEFIRQDMGSIWEVMRPITGAGKPETVPLWQKVTLPHCFNAEDAVDPDVNYYQGPGWYRTMLNIENPYTNGRTCLEFEGAGQKTEVYVYTTRIASHVGGYDEWKADITKPWKHSVARRSAGSVSAERFLLPFAATTAATRSLFLPICPTSTSTADSTDMSTSSIRLPSILSRYG